MHFLGYLPAARAAAQHRWYITVDAACAASAANKAVEEKKSETDGVTPPAAGTTAGIEAWQSSDSRPLVRAHKGVPAKGGSAVKLPASAFGMERATSGKLDQSTNAVSPMALHMKAASGRTAFPGQAEQDSDSETSSADVISCSSSPTLISLRHRPSASAADKKDVDGGLAARQSRGIMGMDAGAASVEAAARRRVLSGASQRNLKQ